MLNSGTTVENSSAVSVLHGHKIIYLLHGMHRLYYSVRFYTLQKRKRVKRGILPEDQRDDFPEFNIYIDVAHP